MRERFAHPLAAVWLAVLAAVGLVGALTGWLSGRSTPTIAAPAPSDSRGGGATLPGPAKPEQGPGAVKRRANPVPRVQPEASSTSYALAWPIWEHELQDGIPARAEPLTPPPWRMVGAVLVDREWQLIIQRGGATEPEFHRQGGRLPGGYLIEQITQEDVTLKVGGRRVVLSYIGSP